MSRCPLSYLSHRAIVHSLTPIPPMLFESPRSVYAGFDPTARSLHVGHLLVLCTLARFVSYGHNGIMLIGGATGRVGDPSGKSEDRKLISEDVLRDNAEGVRENLERVTANWKNIAGNESGGKFEVVDNYEWTEKLSALELLRDVGKYFRLGNMLSKDSVKSRLDGEGISFTEFSYSLLQANDFAHLAATRNCFLQIGGADQFGNIVAGCDLARKRDNRVVHGLTVPLLTNKQGEKMGKTASGPIWLDPTKTSAYEFYQYFLNLDDEVSVKLAGFDCVPTTDEEFTSLIATHNSSLGSRFLQKKLALHMTRLVHGSIADDILKASEAMFGKSDFTLLPKSTWENILICMKGAVYRLDPARLETGVDLIDLAIELGAIERREFGETLLRQGGLYLNKERVKESFLLTRKHLIMNLFFIFRIGKKHQHVVTIQSI